MRMGTEGLLQFIAKVVLQNGRLSDKRNLAGVLNAFLGLFPARTGTISNESLVRLSTLFRTLAAA